MKATLPKIAFLLLAVGLGFGGFFAVAVWRFANRSPDQVAVTYARAVYARDYARAWEFIASEDKRYKTREQYLAENDSFTGLAQELAYTLAGRIRFTETQAQVDGKRATITTHIRVPNGNQPEVYEILHTADRENGLTAAERRALVERLEALDAAGQIQNLEGEQIFTLVREWNGWRIGMGWAGAIVVKLTAEVSSGLPWEFYPLQSQVRVLPGETLRATYRATNKSDRTITGKAKHFILPEEYAKYLTTIQCFCFIQQTLEPGETADLTLIFRIDYEVPADVREFENRYIFYPIESFPQD